MLERLLTHAQELAAEPAKIDYFATSLPTRLLFEDDLDHRQRIRAMSLQAQALIGLGDQQAGCSLLQAVLAGDRTMRWRPTCSVKGSRPPHGLQQAETQSLDIALAQSYIQGMLRLSKKADYALISLAYLAERQAQVVSAREIAARCALPLPLLMNILKVLHQRGILRSVRGTSGGYQLAGDLECISLLDLSSMLAPARVETDGEEPVAPRMPLHAAAQALQYQLVRFMKNVTVADLVVPGRRIDVPSERVGVTARCKCGEHSELSSLLVPLTTET